jgi:Molybdopterin-guanine dinucleotide biosynthesis protein A
MRGTTESLVGFAASAAPGPVQARPAVEQRNDRSGAVAGVCIPQVTGVVLVGGESRRMGRDKSLLILDGVTFINRIVDLFRAHFERVLLVGGARERFAGLDVEFVPDLYPGSALGGVYTGLICAETSHIFVSSCDLAFPSPAVLRYLCGFRNDYDAVVPSTKRGYEPLFAVYSKHCADPIREQLVSGNFCAFDYFSHINLRNVNYRELALVADPGAAFLNINTPEDFYRIGGEPWQ